MTSSTLNIALQNASNNNTVYAYITGNAINNNDAIFLLQADGKTPYYPTSPSSTGAALAENCSIPLGAPGSTVVVTIPQVAGGRIWFSYNSELTFLLNPGPALVEPSVSNTSDPNYNITWDFCEFTFNSTQLFANITYVDFVSIPISLTLTNTSGNSTHVSGMNSSGTTTVANNLTTQNNTDGAGWNQLIIKDSSGNLLRVLSPNNGHVINSSLFDGYYETYVSQVWSKYASATLSVDTQASPGVVKGTVESSLLTFPGGFTFTSPSTADIFSCSTGPFAIPADAAEETLALIPRLAAGFNRSTMLIDTTQPSTDVSNFYANAPTNYYSKFVHAANLDGLGYAFPYDDVTATGGTDLSGAVSDGSPQLLTVAVGGNGAHT